MKGWFLEQGDPSGITLYLAGDQIIHVAVFSLQQTCITNNSGTVMDIIYVLKYKGWKWDTVNLQSEKLSQIRHLRQ